MILDHIPSVLQHPRGSLSMERALKQIKALLEEYGGTQDADDPVKQDMINASLDDVDSMLEKIR